MPRQKTQSDDFVLRHALDLMYEQGPEALTFAALSKRCGLSGATLVQRFGNKAVLKQKSLLIAWDRLDADTARLAGSVPRTPEGAIELLVGLTGQYGTIDTYAEGLLILREDLRDPRLRARGAAWRDQLCAALDACFAQTGVPAGVGLLAATHWQGALLWWGFDPKQSVERYVEQSLRDFVARTLGTAAGPLHETVER
ncbi:TetR/AcrR family transcriptional regulator [Pelagibacterium halotolerans]|uniref:Transcriptional regulator, TetR family n=1 Tax=Pelagibacterium halotolerans (strain DSM 22347 / JCM 15775 / CGMCC 1.7692 / B2) TaxID=1082931 RepID=G4RGK7_PELHB|nr:TetR/AcrR family transcriptional regulator [Pelagibacterium halotolerans]AEQ51066.1 transcriptional regulator, TetR family [Pelagibacterium halotolerans B2]QJR19051.1 TetR/AcrR family transcriptional regulator [Pelagibacterium halotolerans]SEA03836.1 transcriptional regulator, TetR family [Pelagibacterium halotolerans]